VSILRRAPREIYRLYSEEEYLAGAAWEHEPAVASSGLQARRILSAALLLGALGAVAGLVATTGLSRLGGSTRRHSLRARSTADTTSPVTTRSRVARPAPAHSSAQSQGPVRKFAAVAVPASDAHAGSRRRERRAALAVVEVRDAGSSSVSGSEVTTPRPSVSETAVVANAEPREFGFEQ
jgi:hypothetical protein